MIIVNTQSICLHCIFAACHSMNLLSKLYLPSYISTANLYLYKSQENWLNSYSMPLVPTEGGRLCVDAYQPSALCTLDITSLCKCNALESCLF